MSTGIGWLTINDGNNQPKFEVQFIEYQTTMLIEVYEFMGEEILAAYVVDRYDSSVCKKFSDTHLKKRYPSEYMWTTLRGPQPVIDYLFVNEMWRLK